MASNTRPKSILLINPNTTEAMTAALKPLVDALNYHDTQFHYFTAPHGVPSINNESDAATSTTTCLPVLQPLLTQHDAFLVCCYSQHPLVAQLRASGHAKPVAGIFESSIATCLQLLNPEERFGIVSTGAQWEAILSDAVAGVLGSGESVRYVGTETTGLNANELHAAPREDVEGRMGEAAKRLLRKGAKGICLGCAGMAGMERVVREACVEELGEVEGGRIRIVNGVVSGVVFLEGALRA